MASLSQKPLRIIVHQLELLVILGTSPMTRIIIFGEVGMIRIGRRSPLVVPCKISLLGGGLQPIFRVLKVIHI